MANTNLKNYIVDSPTGGEMQVQLTEEDAEKSGARLVKAAAAPKNKAAAAPDTKSEIDPAETAE